jgi:hypothetical protein
MTFDDTLADRQTDACAGILLMPVQALEYLKDSLLELRCDADAIIPNDEFKCAYRCAETVTTGGRSLRNLIALLIRVRTLTSRESGGSCGARHRSRSG